MFSLCLGAACRRRKTSPMRGESEARGPQLQVVTLMQRTRLDEQELARMEWRMREEERRQEKEMERRERERLETTEGEQITFGRWKSVGTMIEEEGSDDGWQHELLVVKKMAGRGGEEEDRGSSSIEQVTVHVHQPG